MSRPRSGTTLSARSDSSREYYATNPSQLLTPISTSNSHDTTSSNKEEPILSQSWASAHTLKTVRGGNDSSDEESDDAGLDAGERDALVGDYGGKPKSLVPHHIIDLSPENGVGGRPRAVTFGGLAIPPTPTLPTTTGSQSLSIPRPVRPSRSRASSTSSIPSSLHVGGSWMDRRPMLAAGVKAAVLFGGSLLVLGLMLWTLLPPIDEADEKFVKIPKSFEELKDLNGVLQVYKERNYWRVLGCYITVYLFLQAFSIPGSMYLSILGGAMYGVVMALPLVCTCVATGALLCYIISALLGPAILMNSEKWQRRIDTWKDRIASHGDNLISYLVVLRIAPLPPHWMVNVVAPHLGISMWTFWLSTFLGIIGVSFIHTQIGTTLDQMTSANDFHLISWQNGLGLGGIIVAALVPVAMRRAWKKDLEQAATDDENPSNNNNNGIPSVAIHAASPHVTSSPFPYSVGSSERPYSDSESDRASSRSDEVYALPPSRGSKAQPFEVGEDSDDDDDGEARQALSQRSGGGGSGGDSVGGDMRKASRLLGVDVERAKSIR